MNRLHTRLVLSHLLVALVGALATLLVVRQLAPTLFDNTMRRAGMGPGYGQTQGAPQGGGQGAVLRAQFADAVNQALLIGTLLGVLAAALFGTFAAYRLVRPLGALRESARRMASGDYMTVVALPRDAELADLAHDLNLLGASLADTEKRRIALLGNVAHEMRTPLTVIDGYMEGMIDQVIDTTPTELARVTDETRRLRRLAEDLSALSQVDEGRLRIDLDRNDLSPVVNAAAERLRSQAADRNIELSIEPPAAPMLARIDPDRIAQIVTNVVGNALRACDEGDRIVVHCRSTGELAEVVVTDTGRGLRAEDLDRVFERFYRAEPTRERASTGIGLTISRGLARAHGGDLRAASAGLGQGATFTLTVPLDSRAALPPRRHGIPEGV